MGDEHGRDSRDSMYLRLSMEELVVVSRLAYWKWQLLGFMLDLGLSQSRIPPLILKILMVNGPKMSQDVPTMLKSPRKPMVSGGCWMADTHSIQEQRGMNWHFDKEWRNWSSWLPSGLELWTTAELLQIWIWTMIFWLQIATFEVSFQYWDYWGKVIKRAPFRVCAWTCVYLQSPGLKLEANKNGWPNDPGDYCAPNLLLF